MKRQKIIRAVFMSLVLTAFFSGCAGAPRGFTGLEDIHGLVVDEKNKPAGGYKITAGIVSAVSNETGMFTLKNIAAGDHRLTGSGLGYLPVEGRVAIANRKELLYVRVISYGEFFARMDELFSRGNWKEAEKTAA
ncbi:MAG: carboxypeptidase-like regulatory domain-containing protein, partial [Spirochaetaceae bacterium]|nr:carboxypeptidase-like regulatory domain-containing protein [Spirochaetaceae bacterium]